MNLFQPGMSRRAAAVLAAIIILAVPVAAQDEPRAGPTRTLEGVVVDQSGAPVIGAEVRFEQGSAEVVTARTGDDGSFAVEARGAERLVVRAPGFADEERQLSADEASPLRIVLRPAGVAEQITVTASRTATRLSETAASVLVLSSADLARTPAVTLDDALRQVPGLTLFRRSGSRTSNPTAQGVSLRGVGASGASRALVLADGVPLNDPFGGWVYWGRVPRESIARVEVLRGGASDLYGSAGLGGVINILTNNSPEDATLSFAADYGNQRTPNASLFASRRFGRWSTAVAAEGFYTDGYVLVDEDERGRVDTPAGSKHTTLNVAVERGFARDGRAFLRGHVYGEARRNGTPLQTNRTHIRQLAGGAEWNSNPLGAFVTRAYVGDQVYDQDFSAVAADRQSENLTRSQRVPAQAVGFTAQWSRAVGSRQALVAGLDAREVRGASDERVFVAGRVSSLVGAGGRERTTGIFAQDAVRVTDRLLITAGARYDRWRNYDALSVTRPATQLAQTATIFPDRTESAFSPRASLLYKAADALSLNASVYRAFRAPTLNELYRSFRVGDTLTLANEGLRAERLVGGEAGAFGRLGDRINWRGVFFWSEITGPIANVTLGVTPSLITRQRQNLGRTRSRGAEIEINAPLGARWALSGGYALTDATVRRFPANTALEGLWLPQVPRHQLTVQTRYDNPALVSLSFQGRAVGAQFDDDQNRFRLEPFFVLDGFASRRIARNLEIFAAAENIFNRRYSIGRTPLRTVGPPTLFRAGLRFQL